MSKNLIWKLGPSTGSKNQPRGRKPVKQADPAPESDKQPSLFRSRTNVGGPTQSLSSPVNIFTAQRITNTSPPGAAATKLVAPRAQRDPGKQKKHANSKMKNLSEIGVRKLELENTNQNEHQAPLEEVVVEKHKVPVVVEKHKVPVKEKLKMKVLERVINDFSFSLTLKEIEDDFLLMTGKRPPRNPKKKTSLEKILHPGNRLDEVCAAIDKIEGEAALRKNQCGQ